MEDSNYSPALTELLDLLTGYFLSFTNLCVHIPQLGEEGVHETALS